MKRIVASAGMVAVGMAGLQAANITGLTPQQQAKWWSVSASLRGFYDDNYLNQTKKKGSPGVEVSPSVSLNLPLERTLIAGSYTYTLNYYSDRKDEPTDQSHEVGARLNHKFTPRYVMNIDDSFVYSSEPQIVAGTLTPDTFRRDSSVARNRAQITFNGRLTRRLGFDAGYGNSFYDYEDDKGVEFDDPTTPGLPINVNSLSATLDRVEHLLHFDAQYFFQETTIGFVGYQYGITDHTSKDQILIEIENPLASSPPTVIVNRPGTVRDSISHYVYVGGEHQFSPQLSGAIRLGVQYVDYYKLGETSLGPYVDASGTYTYLPGSTVKLGVKHEHNATDVASSLDQTSTTTYLNVNHRLTARLTGSFLLGFQRSEFNTVKGGSLEGVVTEYLNLGLSANYKITENISANAAYAFDKLWSKVQGPFDRNRVWAGVRITY